MTEIQSITHSFTAGPTVPDIDIHTEEQYDDAARGWFYYWKNDILTEVTNFISKINVFKGQVNTVSAEISQTYSDTQTLKEDTQTIKDDTQILYDDTEVIKADTQTIYDNTVAFANASFGNTFNASGWDNSTDFVNKTTHYKGGWWASLEAVANVNIEPTFISASWVYVGEHRTEITLTAATHTAVVGQYIKVNATTLGSNVVITLPTTPGNRQSVTLLNMDSVNTNTLTIARGDVLHRIIGKLEDAEMNCLCEKTLVFEEITQNWILK